MKKILIGGFTDRGSGIVMKAISDAVFKDRERINTSQMGFLRIVKKSFILSNASVIFQPSIAGNSVMRDLLLMVFMMILSRDITLIILCDPEYARSKVLFDLFIGFSRINKVKNVYIPAYTSEISLIDRLSKLHHIIGDEKPWFDKEGEAYFLYANHLHSDKGLKEFIDDYPKGKIIGSGRYEIQDISRIIHITNSRQEFLSKLTEEAKRRPIFCFLTRYDLAPLLLQELILRGIVIGVKRKSKAERILNSQYYDIKYVFLDGLDADDVTGEEYDRIAMKNKEMFQKYRSRMISCERKEDEMCVLLHDN